MKVMEGDGRSRTKRSCSLMEQTMAVCPIKKRFVTDRPNVLWRKYVVRPTSAGKNHPSVRTIDAYANQTAIEDRGDKPSSPIKLLEGVRKGIDGEFGTAFVMNERKGKTRCKRWKCLNNVFGCTDHLSRISRAPNFAY